MVYGPPVKKFPVRLCYNMNIVESNCPTYKSNSVTHWSEKLVVEQLIHNDSADDYDDEWGEYLSSRFKAGCV